MGGSYENRKRKNKGRKAFAIVVLSNHGMKECEQGKVRKKVRDISFPLFFLLSSLLSLSFLSFIFPFFVSFVFPLFVSSIFSFTLPLSFSLRGFLFSSRFRRVRAQDWNHMDTGILSLSLSLSLFKRIKSENHESMNGDRKGLDSKRGMRLRKERN